MFAGMILGIGVDFAIHLIERFRLARRRALEPDAALDAALAATVPAIVIDGLAVALGFGVLVVSRVPANARLGAMTAVCLLSCLAATLLVIPPLLRVMSSRSR
jgi:predicted RND superfamily exporter protein